MSFLFIAVILTSIAVLLHLYPIEKWTAPIYWAFYLAVGCAGLFGALGLVELLFK